MMPAFSIYNILKAFCTGVIYVKVEPVAGTEYVGCVHAAVCSEYGHEVYAYDNDTNKIKAFSSGKTEAIEKVRK